MIIIIDNNVDHIKYEVYYDCNCKKITPYGTHVENSYLRSSFKRVNYTINHIRELIGSSKNINIVEIGAPPFYLTYLIQELFDLKIIATYYSESDHPIDGYDKLYTSVDGVAKSISVYKI